MSVSFDWEFEEEEADSSRRPDGDAGLPDKRRRWLIWGAVLFTVLAVVGLSVRAWIKGRLSAVEKVEAELRGVVELELKNIVDGDGELFRARQDPTVHGWQARQVARYISNPSAFVPAPGLIPAERPPEIHQVRVAGRSGRAELTRWFQSPSHTATLATPVPFRVTWFYRRGEDGIWYHTAPPEDHWGAHHSWHGIWLDINASEIEAEVLDPVASDLASLVLNGCQWLNCPEGERYILSFDDALAPYIRGNRWTLPALYLTGLPEGDDARAVWVRALEPWLAEALARSFIARGDVPHRVIYRQLVTRLQAELGLAEPVSPDVELLTEALLAGRQHSLSDLWTAGYAPNDPEGNRLLEAQVVAMLEWIEGQVGSERLFELLPALNDYFRVETALLDTYDLMSLDFEAEWFTYLLDLISAEASSVPLHQTTYQALEPPPAPSLSLIPPGNQIAFICDNRVWIGNADGSNLVPLTTRGHRFANLHWSPDGRWLLTAWYHELEASALYLLAADGSGGRLLTDDPSLSVFPVGWSPDGRQAIYYVWRDASMVGRGAEIWAADVETGETRQLPGVPVRSPDGQHLVYVYVAPELALVLLNDDADTDTDTVAIYDLATETITPLVTAADLVEDVLSSNGDFLADGTDPAALADRSLRVLWPLGWSADGDRLVVWAQGTTRGAGVVAPMVMAMVPLDGSSPRVLAYASRGFYGDTTWSPTNPDQLTFAWQPASRSVMEYDARLFDLNAGPIYTATQVWDGAWSPDGRWIAFAELDQVTIVDQEGQARFVLKGGGPCSAAVWNPTADLSALGEPVELTLMSPVDDWSFTNVHIYQDHISRTLRIWGEVANHTGDDQRIVAFIPVIRDDDGDFISVEGWMAFSPDYKALIQAVSLADGQSVPFDLTIHLPAEISLMDDARIVMHVAAEPGEPTRDDLDLPSYDFDLSQWPDAFRVSGTFENPGPDLTEYVVLVVTVYGEGGRVIGWGWRSETGPAYLASGTHDFEIESAMPEIVAERHCEVYSYKIQLFGR
jgi:Tol biopolymer transport system component